MENESAAVLSAESTHEKTGDGMEDETAKRLARVEEGVAVIAAEVVRIADVQAAQGKLIVNEDQRLKLTMRLVDSLHRVLESRGMVPPLPGASDVN